MQVPRPKPCPYESRLLMSTPHGLEVVSVDLTMSSNQELGKDIIAAMTKDGRKDADGKVAAGYKKKSEPFECENTKTLIS